MPLHGLRSHSGHHSLPTVIAVRDHVPRQGHRLAELCPIDVAYRAMNTTDRILVIGASAGGVDALRSLTAGLPADLSAAIFVVLHIGAHKSALPWLLNQAGSLPARHPQDGDLIEPGHIYVAPPDHHMILQHGQVRLTRGPRENWARPAVDPLFRSAAATYGSAVVGLILTGGLNDGTAGLIEVKQHGGIAIVQDPDDAESSSMPRSALQHVAVDHCMPLQDIAALLTTLIGTRDHETTHAAPAWQQGEPMTAEYTLDDPIAVTCPDCGGATRRIERGSLTQYACHIGHVYTAEIMVEAQFAALEISLAASMRALSERGELCRWMEEKFRAAGDLESAALWAAALNEAKERAVTMGALLEAAWIDPDGSRRQAE